jgi:hypothetical protein
LLMSSPTLRICIAVETVMARAWCRRHDKAFAQERHEETPTETA